MDLNKINSYIKDIPAFLKNPDTLLLREAIRKYPYFNSLYILLAIAKNQTDSIFTQDYLRKASIYSGKRAKLKENLSEKYIKRTSGNTVRIKKPEIKTGQKENVKNIIDTFIKNNPSVQRPKAEFYSPVEAASKSISGEDEFVTETIAKIYVRQKNYIKAIKIYERLSLIYPEKSDYFAHLINGLKTKIDE